MGSFHFYLFQIGPFAIQNQLESLHAYWVGTQVQKL